MCVCEREREREKREKEREREREREKERDDGLREVSDGLLIFGGPICHRMLCNPSCANVTKVNDQ